MIRSRSVLTFSLAAALVSSLYADTTSEVFVRSGGFRGMGAFQGTTIRSLQGLKSHEDSNMKFSGALMKFAGGPGNGQTIVRADRDKIWTLNPRNKTYTERAITPPPAKPRKKEQPDETGEEPSDEKPTHRVKKTAFDVKKTGATKTINGFKTEEHVVSLRVDVEEIASKEVTSYLMENRLWNAPWTPALKQHVEEEKKFFQAYLKKLGGALSPAERQSMGETALRLLLGLGGAKTEDLLNQVKKKTEALTGYPIVTESTWTVQEDPRAIARRKAEADAAAADEEDLTPDMSGGVKGLAGGLLGGFAKKKMKAHQDKKAEERAAKPVFSTYTELKRIDTKPVTAARFEVPAGYKLKK